MILIWIVVGSSVLLFFIIWLFIKCFTNKITNPIKTLTEITNEIKKDTGRESRLKV